MIRFFQQDTDFNINYKSKIKEWIKLIVSQRGCTVGEINVIFCSDPCILEINRKFLGHDYFTDIITFDNSSPDYFKAGVKVISADLFISIDTVRVNAEDYSQSFEDELHRVIIHGILHLVGENDISREQIASMRSAENAALDELKKLFDLKNK